MDEIYKIAKQYNLVVIEDAPHALGADYKRGKIGSISDMTSFSFHHVKHITTGEGGMRVTNNQEFYKKLHLFWSHGITRDENLMYKSDGDWHYEQLALGYNYRITELQCTIGITQMKKSVKFITRRKDLVDR